jgi:predicted RNA-binding Zn ribbon-like protein
VNAALARAPARSKIVAAGGELRFVEEDEAGEPLERPLWPVLWDAAALLTSDRRAWVHTCHDPECAWMFLDLSRNRTRRWCSMAECGNRAKARRHYQRVNRQDA